MNNNTLPYSLEAQFLIGDGSCDARLVLSIIIKVMISNCNDLKIHVLMHTSMSHRFAD